MRRAQGFTLIELLVALAILGTVSVMAFGGLRAIMTARNNTDESAARLAELQRGWNIIQRDIEQVINRPIRNEYGDIAPAIMGSNMDGVLTFTRTGYPNPLNLRRSSLVRVSYEIEEEGLVRSHWTALDGANEEQQRSLELISGVVGMEITFLDENDKWLEEWPEQRTDGLTISWQPKAVNVLLELKDYGEINRIFRVAGFHSDPTIHIGAGAVTGVND